MELGQIAFEAYVKSRGGKNHDGTDTPAWEDLGLGVQQGWQKAAEAVAAHVSQSIEAARSQAEAENG